MNGFSPRAQPPQHSRAFAHNATSRSPPAAQTLVCPATNHAQSIACSIPRVQTASLYREAVPPSHHNISQVNSFGYEAKPCPQASGRGFAMQVPTCPRVCVPHRRQSDTDVTLFRAEAGATGPKRPSTRINSGQSRTAPDLESTGPPKP